MVKLLSRGFLLLLLLLFLPWCMAGLAVALVSEPDAAVIFSVFNRADTSAE